MILVPLLEDSTPTLGLSERVVVDCGQASLA